MMRQAGATIASVQSAVAQASPGDVDCGFFGDCNNLQPGAAASAALAAVPPAQTVR
jgi:hypothetical protein